MIQLDDRVGPRLRLEAGNSDGSAGITARQGRQNRQACRAHTGNRANLVERTPPELLTGETAAAAQDWIERHREDALAGEPQIDAAQIHDGLDEHDGVDQQHEGKRDLARDQYPRRRGHPA
jgi:hypothetical protein